MELITIEKDIHKSSYNISSHHHNHYELVYYISGEGNLIIDNKHYKFKPSNFALVTPGTLHTEYSSKSVSLIYIGFVIKDNNLSSIKNGVFKCPINIPLLKLLKVIRNEKEQKAFYQNEIIEHLLQALVVLVKRTIKMTKSKSQEMENIKNYIHENIKKINLNGVLVAKQFNYNYDYFRKAFRDYTHVSISDYIAKEKVDLAYKLLKSTNYSIKQIGEKCNFSSTSHFIAIFKKYYNITPKQFLLNYDKNTENK